MDDNLQKLEVGLIAKLVGAISIDGFRKLLTKNIIEVFTLSHKNTSEEFGFRQTAVDPRAIDYLRERTIILSDKTAAKLEGDLKFELIEALKNNESIGQITKRLDKIFTDMMSWQLERIARTESLNAMNAGRMSAYENSGVVQYKMVITAKDKRTSDLCRRMRGQIQELDQPFKDRKTGDSWMHPPFHPNCRSSVIPLRKLPDNVITIGGSTYAADKMFGKIEISTTLLKSQQKKAWVVRYANGHAVQCFEDEKDADYFIETSKKKDAGWFDFGGKTYREVKPGWDIHKKGARITFEVESEDK